MFLLGFRRKLTALALCKSNESAIQWFLIHHRITFVTIQNSAVYLSSARVSIFSTLVPRLLLDKRCLSHGMCFYQVIITLHFLNDVVNDAESTQKSKNTSYSLV